MFRGLGFSIERCPEDCVLSSLVITIAIIVSIVESTASSVRTLNTKALQPKLETINPSAKLQKTESLKL